MVSCVRFQDVVALWFTSRPSRASFGIKKPHMRLILAEISLLIFTSLSASEVLSFCYEYGSRLVECPGSS